MNGVAEIMIVDDDADVRAILAEILKDEGYLVASAANGRVALDLLAGGARPAVVLLDLMMPVMDGWAFRAAQKRDAAIASIPVIVFTAHGTAEEAAEELSAAAFLRKPVQLDELMRTLERVRRRANGGGNL